MEIPTTPAEMYALISRVNLSTTTEFLQEVWKALPLADWREREW